MAKIQIKSEKLTPFGGNIAAKSGETVILKIGSETIKTMVK